MTTFKCFQNSLHLLIYHSILLCRTTVSSRSIQGFGIFLVYLCCTIGLPCLVDYGCQGRLRCVCDYVENRVFLGTIWRWYDLNPSWRSCKLVRSTAPQQKLKSTGLFKTECLHFCALHFVGSSAQISSFFFWWNNETQKIFMYSNSLIYKSHSTLFGVAFSNPFNALQVQLVVFSVNISSASFMSLPMVAHLCWHYKMILFAISKEKLNIFYSSFSVR